MGGYSLSAKADNDLDGLYEYTILSFGVDQARSYLSGLHERFEFLAQHPAHGRSAAELAAGLRRVEYRSHVVFYRPTDDGVLIVRVLHHSMDVERHL